jgi:hypothetical protein
VRINHLRNLHFIKRMAIGLILIQLTAFGTGRYNSAASRAPGLEIDSVNPSTGSTTVDTDILITGYNFADGASVMVGNSPALRLVVLNSYFIDALIAPQAPGTVDVQVTNKDGQSARLTASFTFQVPPPFEITAARVDGKNLLVTGHQFGLGSVLLVNGVDQKTLLDSANPGTTLIGKKVGKRIAVGQTVALQVRNAAGALSPQFMYTRPQ